jgi:hypothetical protein
MRTSIRVTAVLVCALLLAGCTTGLIYTHTVKPLDPNMRNSVQTSKTSGQGDIRQIMIQGISVTWGDDSIGTIAREKGLTELYYADREILSVLFGLWSQEFIHVYGR